MRNQIVRSFLPSKSVFEYFSNCQKGKRSVLSDTQYSYPIQLYTKWIGQGSETTESLSDTMVLTIGQTMTTFLFLSATFGLTLFLLCGECIFHSIHRKHHRWQDFISYEEEDENATERKKMMKRWISTDLRIRNLTSEL